jgi:hypothetical protein
MKFAYIRPTKHLSEQEQRDALAGITFDGWYVDEKPSRGDPGWYWREMAILACRPGSGDEIHVSHASVIADSASQALDKLAEITARGAVLVVAATGRRYSWHPDAVEAMELAREMERETRRAVAKIGGNAYAKRQAEKREREARKMRKAERMWRDKSVSTAAVIEFSGLSRAELYNRFGPRGTPRFWKKKEST